MDAAVSLLVMMDKPSYLMSFYVHAMEHDYGDKVFDLVVEKTTEGLHKKDKKIKLCELGDTFLCSESIAAAFQFYELAGDRKRMNLAKHFDVLLMYFGAEDHDEVLANLSTDEERKKLKKEMAWVDRIADSTLDMYETILKPFWP